MSVEATLSRYGAMTSEVARIHLDGDSPGPHLYDLVRVYPGRGGKAIRPSLCLASCVAFGGTAEEALDAAAAIELLHNAFLVHDDIEDESELRRGEPTLWVTDGVPLAINVGDALGLMAAKALRHGRDRLGARLADRLGDEFDLMARHTVEGQAIELGWRRDNVVDVTPDDYLDLILRKTCWYTTIHPLRVGAIIGTWDRAPLDELVRFGFYLGAAFQIRDDVLNLVGDEQRYGKELLGDLYEGKRTLMLIHLLGEATGSERDALDRFLARSRAERSPADVAHVLALMHHHGSIEFAEEFGRGIADAATDAFEDAFASVPPSTDRDFIRALIDWMLFRDA